MIIVNRKAFALGCLLAGSFLGVLALIFSPLFGGGRNGLEYADALFNRLSKGSSYFIPKVAAGSAAHVGEPFTAELRFDGQTDAARAAALVARAEARVRQEGAILAIDGDLGRLLVSALRDADDGYRNDGAALQARHGMPAQAVLASWWKLLQRMDKALKQEKRLGESKAVLDVMKKAIEPAHNYFGIEAERVGNMLAPMGGLLIFYVLYTMWWGYAIFFLFEGCGLVMKKKEAPATDVAKH